MAQNIDTLRAAGITVPTDLSVGHTEFINSLTADEISAAISVITKAAAAYGVAPALVRQGDILIAFPF